MKRILPGVVALLLAVTLAGCSASGGGSSSGASSDSKSVQSAAEPATADGSTKESTVNRAVITTGTVTLTVTNPSKAADRASIIADDAGGRVDGREEKAPADGDRGSATLTLRIPAAKLDGALRSLRSLGTVVSVDISAKDVTSAAQDLAARITALRTSVDRLVTLLSKATTTADLITIESTLSDRQASLESLEAEQRVMNDQVALATITLRLGSVATAPKQTPATFASGLGAGWDSLVGFFSVLVVVLGVLLPWLALAAVITGIVLGSIRFSRRRRGSAPAPE